MTNKKRDITTKLPRRITKCVTLCLALLFAALGPGVAAGNHTDGKDEGTILVVASYNPDTRRMSDFISQFENEMGRYGHSFMITVENLGCKGLEEAHTWRGKMTDLLDRYKNDDLRAIVLLGQEAWASFLSQEDYAFDVPFFGCYVSENGVILPEKKVDPRWMPKSVNMLETSARLGRGGGYINRYDLAKNVDLILSLYPSTEHIAFVSDNTYGGISLQALIQSQVAEFPNLDFIFVDGRRPEQYAIDQIANLPPRSVVLLGTWRVGREGQYFMSNSVSTLITKNPNIPVFTISGTGFGEVAIGGYQPIYQNGASLISRQIDQYCRNKRDAVSFSGLEGEYRFDKIKLLDFSIPEYKLPKNSIVQDGTALQVRKYRNYILLALCALCVLSVLALFLYYLYHKNKVLKDVLQRREHELIEARDRAEESDRLKSAFLANMSHEIRTPLNAIVGFSSLLTGDLTLEERAEYSSIITTNSELMLALIGDILDISRLETGRMQFHFEKYDIVGLCQQALFSTTHNRKPGVECSVDSACKSYLMTTDHQRFLQVVNNLLINAGKYTESGKITVGIEVHEEQGEVQFSVTDTGSGIPLAEQGRVFERFEKLDEFKQGTGLGLAICKQIVHAFGGRIWVDPAYTDGCRVIFTHKISDFTEPAKH